MARKPKSTLVDGAEDPVEAELLAQLEVCRVRRLELPVGGFDKEVTNGAARVTMAIAAVKKERRQQEKHTKDMVARMTVEERDALVLEYVKELTPERRAEFRKFIDDLDADENLLG